MKRPNFTKNQRIGIAILLIIGLVAYLVINSIPLYNSVGFSWTFRLIGFQISTVGALIMPVKVVLQEKDDKGYAKIAIVVIGIGFVLQSIGNLTAIPVH